MSLLTQFFQDHQFDYLAEVQDAQLGNIQEDYSGYVYVDGEEGDYGDIKYTLDGELLATKTVHGGDRETWDWTEAGKTLLRHHLIQIVARIGY